MIFDINKMIRRAIMKKNLFSIILPICFILTAGCSKEEDPVISPEVSYNEQKLVLVSHPVFGGDSIFYSNDLISEIARYKIVNGVLKPVMNYTLSYNDNSIRLSSIQPEFGSFSIIMKDLQPSLITGSASLPDVSFVYERNRLKFFIYKWKSYDGQIATDSMAVTYDNAGENIIKLERYVISDPSGSAKLLYSTSYRFDDKRNPFKASTYAFTEYWKSPDDVITYFNSNNIISIDSHRFSYSYDQNNYPVYQEISTYGRTSFYYESK
jgi:hypothetical protein